MPAADAVVQEAAAALWPTVAAIRRTTWQGSGAQSAQPGERPKQREERREQRPRLLVRLRQRGEGWLRREQGRWKCQTSKAKSDFSFLVRKYGGNEAVRLVVSSAELWSEHSPARILIRCLQPQVLAGALPVSSPSAAAP